MTSKFGVARALEVRRPPLDHELPVRRASEHCGEDASTGLVGAQVVQIRDERAVEAVDRQGLTPVDQPPLSVLNWMFPFELT